VEGSRSTFGARITSTTSSSASSSPGIQALPVESLISSLTVEICGLLSVSSPLPSVAGGGCVAREREGHGLIVTGLTYEDCRELGKKLLRYEDSTSAPLTSLQGSSLTGLLRATGLKKKLDEDLDVYTERVKVTLADRWAKEEGKRSK